MNFTVTIDWKFIVALGAAVGISILASKVDSSSAEQALIHVIDAYKDCADACKSVR